MLPRADPEVPRLDKEQIFLEATGGSLQSQTMRVHFTYPFRYNRPVYVVYIGPKLTKR